MLRGWRCSCFLLLSGSRLWAQGPPYQTDDPVPVDLHHYEFYIFGGVDGTPVEMRLRRGRRSSSTGARCRACRCTRFCPGAWLRRRTIPSICPAAQGPSAFGLTDMELGAKIAFIKETKHFPQIGSFTMFEMPTGDSTKGLGVGKVWYKLPIWLQKNEGKWLFDGGARLPGGSADRLPQFSLRRISGEEELNERLELGAEVFAHGSEGLAAAQTEASAMIDVGGYYHFKHMPGRAVSVLLRALGGGADGKLRLCGHVLDVGERRQEGAGTGCFRSRDCRANRWVLESARRRG